MIGLRRRFARRRNHQDRKCVIQRSAGPKILVGLARLQNSYIAGLMAGHADVINQEWSEPCGIDDVQVLAFELMAGCKHRCSVKGPRPVAVFAADRQFGEGWVLKVTIAAGDRTRTSTVAKNTSGEDRAAESVVAEFVTG